MPFENMFYKQNVIENLEYQIIYPKFVFTTDPFLCLSALGFVALSYAIATFGGGVGRWNELKMR